MATKVRERDKPDIDTLIDYTLPCPSCRFGKLVRLSLYKWECSTCGYWTVRPPRVSQQGAEEEAAGGFTPRTQEQKEELRRGREYWNDLTQIGKKAIFGFLMTYALLSFTLNIAVRAALDSSLSLTWTISSWAVSISLGILSLLLFISSSLERKLAFAAILLFFTITGPFWFDLARAIAAI